MGVAIARWLLTQSLSWHCSYHDVTYAWSAIYHPLNYSSNENMSNLQKAWIAPIVTGTIAAVLGSLALLLLNNPAKIDVGSEDSGARVKRVSAFPTPPASEWEPMQNEASYARNYSRTTKQDYERFAQVVTVYETPMASDRRTGKEVAPGEYIEIFKVGEPTDVVIHVRIDKGKYWLLSRQRIALRNWSHLVTTNPEAGSSDFLKFQSALQNIIDSTRHFLQMGL